MEGASAWALRSLAPSATAGEDALGGGLAGHEGAVRGREVARRDRFAGEEKASLDGRREAGAIVGGAGPRMGVGAERPRVPIPGGGRERGEAAADVAAVE